MSHPGPIDARGTIAAPLALALATFAVYAAGACPTIYVGDSGELVAAVHVLGIPHPTGYPLYVLLGKLWTVLLPVGSVAWRLSLFSAVAAAATCGLLYQLGRVGGLHPVACGAAALTLAFAPSFWAEANIQRVYTLGSFFVVLATTLAFRWYQNRSVQVLGLALFVCALGACNHTFMIIYAGALGVFALAVGPQEILQLRRLAALSVTFVAGLLPYLYLPLRSRQNPPLDWGNPETLEAFLGVVLRRDFWDRAWVESGVDLLTVVGDYLRSFTLELTWVGVALAVTGVLVARRRWPLALLIALMAGNVAAMALHGSRADIFIWHRYYIPSYVFAALLVGAGADRLIGVLPRPARWLPLALPAFLLINGWQVHDRSRYSIADSYSRAVLQMLPPGAHLAASDDNVLFSLMYLTMVEGLRPDVDLIMQGVGGVETPPLHFDGDEERLFFTHHPNWQLPGLAVVPVGLVFEVRRAGSAAVEPMIPFDALPGEDDARVPKDYLTQCMVGDFHYMLGFSFEESDWPRARLELTRAAKSAPDNGVLFYNLGLLYRRNGLWDDAIAAFQRSHEIDPRPLIGRGHVRAVDRLAEVQAEKERLGAIERRLIAGSELESDHRHVADLLGAAGESVAARGHRLRALEAESLRVRGTGIM